MRMRRESMPAIITITAATNVIVIIPRRHHTAAASRIRHGRSGMAGLLADGKCLRKTGRYGM